jgi:rRNA maturation endonuclease Nob1
LKNLYAEAIERGSEVAKVLIAKSDEAQEQAADKFKEIAQVISEQATITQQQAVGRFQSAVAFLGVRSQGARQQIAEFAGKAFKPAAICPACGRKAPGGAIFCAYCGKPLNP